MNKLIIVIESVDGDKLLAGKALTLDALKLAVNEILKTHSEQDFVRAFCARFGYRELPYSNGYAAYIVDLDTHMVLVTSYTFPKELDGAKVLYYSERGNFEPVYYPGGEIAHNISYLAVCKYDNDEEYYVFHCDGSLEVVADDCLPSLEVCMKYMDRVDTKWYRAE